MVIQNQQKLEDRKLNRGEELVYWGAAHEPVEYLGGPAELRNEDLVDNRNQQRSDVRSNSWASGSGSIKGWLPIDRADVVLRGLSALKLSESDQHPWHNLAATKRVPQRGSEDVPVLREKSAAQRADAPGKSGIQKPHKGRDGLAGQKRASEVARK